MPLLPLISICVASLPKVTAEVSVTDQPSVLACCSEAFSIENPISNV